jgi:hypothetical protein
MIRWKEPELTGVRGMKVKLHPLMVEAQSKLPKKVIKSYFRFFLVNTNYLDQSINSATGGVFGSY